MNKINKANTAVEVTAPTAMTAQTAYPFSDKDGKTLFVCENPSTTSAVNLVIEAGDGLQATGNLTFAIPSSKTICFALESGKYKKLYGDNKGCVLMTGSGVKVSTYILP